MKHKVFKSLVYTFIFSISLLRAQSPEIMWWFDTFDSSFGQSAVEDIDNDGKYEIVFGCYRNDGMVYALNAEDGSLLWKYKPAGSAEGCNDAAMLIFDVNNDNYKDVIVASSCTPATVCLNGVDGTVIWQTQTRGSDSPPSIADLDNDGKLEILHGEFNGYVICMDALTGKQKWEILVDDNSWVQTAPTIVDIDGDDSLDFVVATWGFDDNSRFYAYNGSTQELMWSYPLNDKVYHGTAVADLDKDGKPELVFGDYSGRLYILNAEDGTRERIFIDDYYIGAPPAIGDINGDGSCEIVFSSYNHIVSLDNQGKLLWVFTIADYGICFRGVVLSDINGDAIPEVIFGTSTGMVNILDGKDGNLIDSINLQSHIGKEFDIDHAPVIADFDSNDTLDLFIHGGKTEYPEYQNNYGRGYAISLGKGTGPEWKMFQHDYFRSSSLCNSVPPLSAPQTIDSDEFSVYPSPVGRSDRLFFKTATTLDHTVSIFDYTGKIIFCGSDINSIDLQPLSLSNGIYFIKFHSVGKIVVKKFIVCGD